MPVERRHLTHALSSQAASVQLQASLERLAGSGRTWDADALAVLQSLQGSQLLQQYRWMSAVVGCELPSFGLLWITRSENLSHGFDYDGDVSGCGCDRWLRLMSFTLWNATKSPLGNLVTSTNDVDLAREWIPKPSACKQRYRWAVVYGFYQKCI